MTEFDPQILPTLIATSVVRGSEQGESHGGVFLVDLAAGTHRQVVDWDNVDIDFSGRGWDRGLRGIAVVGDDIYIAASDELFVFDRDFSISRSYRNPYLRHCHEIMHHDGRLYLTSTGFDSLLAFDLATGEFNWGLNLSLRQRRMIPRPFDPRKSGGPGESNVFHLNSVYHGPDGLTFSGLKIGALVRVTDGGIAPVMRLPQGLHNAQQYNDGVLFNDTKRDAVCWLKGDNEVRIGVPRYNEADILYANADTSGIARQAFARGLCPLENGMKDGLGNGLVAGGSSPSTIAVYDLNAGKMLNGVALTMDVRNAIHGLAIWPFGPASA